MLQIELFDPHEPFFVHDHFKQLYGELADPDADGFDWPAYRKVSESPAMVEAARRSYAALVTMCDKSLGRVLDFMDAHDMWDDTMLIVNTDHGFLLGEHGWWAKSVMPWFDELIHLPFFLWDPRSGEARCAFRRAGADDRHRPDDAALLRARSDTRHAGPRPRGGAGR